jgi:hypothetical protein
MALPLLHRRSPERRPDSELVCDGCGARVGIRHDPTDELIEGVEVFVNAHARCKGRVVGYRIGRQPGRDGR